MLSPHTFLHLFYPYRQQFGIFFKEQDILQVANSYTWKFFGYLKSSHSQRKRTIFWVQYKWYICLKVFKEKGGWTLEIKEGMSPRPQFIYFRIVDLARRSSSPQKSKPPRVHLDLFVRTSGENLASSWKNVCPFGWWSVFGLVNTYGPHRSRFPKVLAGLRMANP